SSERVFAKGRVGVRERPPVCVGNATARIFPADAFTGGEVVERDPALCVKRGVGFSGFRHVHGDAAH
ncbi:hypothetical protein, partial [Eggerthella lenta]|uniref:hypothetical protein n=1 Tax=Eggerthella lenta TaxID=84112 RepID=UPI001E56A9F1